MLSHCWSVKDQEFSYQELLLKNHCTAGHLIVSRMKEEVARRPVDEEDDEEDGTRHQEQQLDPVLLLQERLGNVPYRVHCLVKFWKEESGRPGVRGILEKKIKSKHLMNVILIQFAGQTFGLLLLQLG